MTAAAHEGGRAPALRATPATRLRRTVGQQVVGLEAALADLRASLDRARRDKRDLAEEVTRLRRALVHAEAAKLQALDERADTGERLAEERALAQRSRELEARNAELGDRCADLALAVERERRASRELREDLDAVMGEVERLCAVVGRLLEEGGAPR